MIDVVVADDQEIARAGLQLMLERDPDIRVVGQAADGHEAVRMARALRPDVCTLDIRMPGLSGLEVTRELVGDDDPPAIVIVTTFDLDEYLFEALAGGASGFVLKDAPAPVVIGAVHTAAQGEALISPGPTARLIEAYLRRPARAAALPVELTVRERDVLSLVCEGRSNGDIAAELFISSSTVKGHVANLMKKTAATNRVGLVIWAYRCGFATDPTGLADRSD